jgi:hypothetical protein
MLIRSEPDTNAVVVTTYSHGRALLLYFWTIGRWVRPHLLSVARTLLDILCCTNCPALTLSSWPLAASLMGFTPILYKPLQRLRPGIHNIVCGFRHALVPLWQETRELPAATVVLLVRISDETRYGSHKTGPHCIAWFSISPLVAWISGWITSPKPCLVVI